MTLIMYYYNKMSSRKLCFVKCWSNYDTGMWQIRGQEYIYNVNQENLNRTSYIKTNIEQKNDVDIQMKIDTKPSPKEIHVMNHF